MITRQENGTGQGLTELSACTREFLAISRSTETSRASLAGRRWSELDEVEVDMSRSVVRPAALCGGCHVTCYVPYTSSLYRVSPRTLPSLPLCVRIFSFYAS